MKKYIFPVMLVALSALMLQVSTADKDTATLVAVKGKVLVMKAGTDKWISATEKMALAEGDTLKTEAGSTAIMKLENGSMTKIGPMSKMKLENLGGSGKALKVGLDMESGRNWARVSKLSGESSFKVKTPAAVAGVRGTYFSSEAENASSRFDVFDGEVEVSSRNDPSQSVILKERETTSVENNKAPAEPSKLSDQEMQNLQSGFSGAEFTKAKYEVQVSISPETLKPGEKASAAIQVLADGVPLKKAVQLTLKLSGSATFADGKKEAVVNTDENGSLSMEITDPVEETVSMSASMKIAVTK